MGFILYPPTICTPILRILDLCIEVVEEYMQFGGRVHQEYNTPFVFRKLFYYENDYTDYEKFVAHFQNSVP